MLCLPLPSPPKLRPGPRQALTLFMASDPAADARQRDAFERRMTEAWPAITQLVERLLAWPGKSSDVEDVVQEVFLRAWRNRGQFRGEADWATWVHQITVRHARSAGRARSRRGRWFGRLLGPESPELNGTHDVKSSGSRQLTVPEEDGRPAALRQALARLGHADREVIVLRYLEELGGDEVASRLDLTRAAVDARLSRARKRLRALVGSEEMPS